MKKTAIILFLVLAIPALLTSCLFDEEDLFDKSASERIEAAKQEAKTVLESAENGWHVRYFPSPTQEFGGYNLFFKFSEGSVTVASEIESNPSTTETSLYSFGEDLGVTLNFDTKNSLINYFVHPKNPDNIGSTYKGMEGDYKFTVMETSAAMVVLRGIITGNYYILTPVSADTDWSEDLETYRNNAEDMSFNTYSFVVKDKTYSATLTNRRFAVKIDSETTVYAPFIYTKAGISFYMPVEIDGVTAQNFTFVDDYYFAEVNGADFKIMTPEPVRSDITFEVTVPDATKTYNSVTVNTVPSTDTEYYYMGLMLKSEFEAQREKKLLQSLVGALNGNIGAGVAVAGAFSLVRFRSAPGTAREIGVLFLGMAIGLATGMGYVGLAALTFVIVSAVLMALTALGLGQKDGGERLLKITIPEDLDYTGVFDPILAQYATKSELKQVKTTNMGSLFKLTYDLTLRDGGQEKALIDTLRQRNGNLEISLCQQETGPAGL